MNRVVWGAFRARLWAFLFPSEVSGFPSQGSGDESRQRHRHRGFLVWLVAGLVFPAVGWIAGSFLGSWAPRITCATAATALALGWLLRRPGAALVGALSAGLASLAAVLIGESFFSPVMAWPLAGLAIGVMGAFAFRRLRARIAFIVAAPVLGCAGFVAGALATVLGALALSDSRMSAQFMLGGAAGFGFLLMAGAAIAARWLDAARAAGGVS